MATIFEGQRLPAVPGPPSGGLPDDGAMPHHCRAQETRRRCLGGGAAPSLRPPGAGNGVPPSSDQPVAHQRRHGTRRGSGDDLGAGVVAELDPGPGGHRHERVPGG